MKKQLKNVGFTTTFLGIVLSALLGVQLLAIVLLTQGVNVTTSSLADLMQRSNEYQQAATKLQAGTSVLAETAAAFVQSPIVQGGPDAGSFNAGPLRSYAQELSLNRRGAQIAAQFQEYDVSEEVRGYIDAAAAYSEQMGDIQTHAISLLLSVYPLPDEPVLRTIPLIELTEEERALSAEERVAAAKALMFGRDYSLLKSYVYENTEKCHALLQARFNAATAESERHVAVLRAAL